jgi:Cu/Ag efflux protein CusF
VAVNQIVLTGIVLAVDPVADRVTIAYEACEPLNWPAGAMPFAMVKPGMLGDIQVRQKVRFTLDSHRIARFLPVASPGAAPDPGSAGRPPPPR